jgi:hypothetical protein
VDDELTEQIHANSRPSASFPVIAVLRTFRAGVAMSLMLRIVLGGMLITMTLRVP